MWDRKNRKFAPLPSASAQPDSAGTPQAGSPPAANTPTTPPASATAVKTIVIAVPSAEVAALLQTHIRVWTLPDCRDVTVRAMVSPPGEPDEKLASVLAEVGGDLDDLAASFPNIQLGWPTKETE